jgi:hypothetical protein
VHSYDPSARFNTPLVIAAHLFNSTPDIVFASARTARGVKAAFVACAKGTVVDNGLLQIGDADASYIR